MIRLVLTLSVLMLVAACSDSGNPNAASAEADPLRPTQAQVDFANSAAPADEAIAKIYQRSCRNCHAIAGVSAPLTGHVEDWSQRISERGRDGLLRSTKFGYRAMPARGLCGNCSDEEYLALIDFMMAPPPQ